MEMKIKDVSVGHLIHHSDSMGAVLARVTHKSQMGDVVRVALQNPDGEHIADLLCHRDELVEVHVAEGN